MKFPVLTIVFIFIVWLTFTISRHKSDFSDKKKAFWDKEMASNAVRKKSLDDLAYISFPFFKLPSEQSFTERDQNIPSSLLMLLSLQGKKIVNFNNISNTDLKLQYGTANLNVLTEYDNNFITLCREGHLLTEYLYDQDRKEEAQDISEALIECGSDVSKQFTLLARIYEESGQKEKKEALLQKAQGLTSSRKNAIIKALEELDKAADAPSSDPAFPQDGKIS